MTPPIPVSPARGRRSLLAGLAAAALLLAARPFAADARPEGETLTASRARNVEVRSTVPRVATVEACRRALEDAVPLYAAVWPAKAPEEVPLSLLLTGTKAEYAAVVTAAGAGFLAGNLAATLDRTGESVVMIQPRADDAALARAGDLPELLRLLVIHEGAHQYVRRVGVPGAGMWPAWYAEGTAEWIAARAVSAARAKGTGTPLCVDDRRWRMAAALERDDGIPLGRLLRAQAATFDGQRLLYAHAFSLVEFLAVDEARFRRLHGRIASLPEPRGSGDDAVRELEEAFARELEAVYGPLDALQERWHAHVRAAAPRWCEVWRAVEEIAEGRYLCSSFPGEGCVAVRREPPPAGGYVLAGTLAPLAPGQQANLVVAFERIHAPRFLCVAVRGDGTATLLAWADGHWQGRYRVTGRLPEGTPDGERPLAFRLTVTAASLLLSLDGDDVAEFDVPPGFDAAGGRWGIGAYDSVVEFSGLAVEGLPR